MWLTVACGIHLLFRSNFVGTEFTVYDSGVNPKDAGYDMSRARNELALVTYVRAHPLPPSPHKLHVLARAACGVAVLSRCWANFVLGGRMVCLCARARAVCVCMCGHVGHRQASNVLGSKGPRKMKVCVPRVNDRNERVEFKPTGKDGCMIARLKANDLSQMVFMINKPPRWNDGAAREKGWGGASCSHVLTFALCLLPCVFALRCLWWW